MPAMNVLTKPRMTVDQFLDWAVGRPGRYELLRGEVIALSPETADHADMKGVIYRVLWYAIRQKGLDCHVFTDGMTVRIDGETAYEPDAVVYGGEKIKGAALEAAGAFDPGGDLHASPAYRRHLAEVLVARALRAAHAHARSTR